MLFLLLAANAIAVQPVEGRGALSGPDAAALTDELRSIARETLGPHGVSIVDDDGRADAIVRSRAAQMEGATVVTVGVYKASGSSPFKAARVVGFGLAELRKDARAKVPKLLAEALGFAPSSPEPLQRPGTLRIPGGQPAPASPPPAASPPSAPPPAARPPPAPHGPEDPLVATIREVTSDVEKLRGLRRKQNLKVRVLDDKLFREALREKALKELTAAAVAAERARWLAFALAPPGADPAAIYLGVLDEQVAGFYDPFTKQLIVRQEPPASAGELGPDGLRTVLAHEIEHALQDQNFGIPDLATLPDDDARLARSALLEGDAMAVMTAYAAQRAHKPVKPAIAAGAAALRSVDTETLLRTSGKSPALASAPAILREELVLPYSGGFGLVAEAFRRGGFALVDRMFQRPPVSARQILHPESYFAGELPAAVAAPAAPPGTQVLATGRMGELGTRIALEVCADRAVAREVSGSWAGDAYTIVEDRNHSVSLLWTTVWRRGGAEPFANLLRLELPCWQDQSESTRGRIAAAARFSASGDRVVLARGSVDLDSALQRQLASPIALPKPVPMPGDAAPPAEVPPARVEAGHFVSPRLGLSGEVPPGFEADPGNPASEVSIRREGPAGGSASLSFAPEPLSGEALDTFFQTAAAQIATAQGARLSFSGKSARKLLGSRGEERTWQIEGKDLTLRIAYVPWCGGKGSLTLLRIEGSEATRDALERFASSLAQSGPSPACTDLE